MQDDESIVAVLAHGMLSSMAVVKMAVSVLSSEDQEPGLRKPVTDLAFEQIALITDALVDLARGLPCEALVMLSREEARVPASIVGR